jgi:alpha-N-arabinofuranosidase
MTSTISSAFELSYQRHQRQEPNPYPTAVSHPAQLRSIPIYINPDHLVHPNEPPISDLLYSGFLEHLGRCIYGGIVDDYRNPSPPDLLFSQETDEEHTKGRLGWRKDVKELLAKDGDLQVPMMRWPGGEYLALRDFKLW